MLAPVLSEAGVCRIFPSEEPKYIQTGKVIGHQLRFAITEVKSLHQNDRTGVKYLESDVFQQVVSDLFSKPGEQLFGAEAGQAAIDRFCKTIENIERELDDQEAAFTCISRGAVVSLHTAHLTCLVGCWISRPG